MDEYEIRIKGLSPNIEKVKQYAGELTKNLREIPETTASEPDVALPADKASTTVGADPPYPEGLGWISSPGGHNHGNSCPAPATPQGHASCPWGLS